MFGASATLHAAELVRIVSAASFEPITAPGSIVSLFGEGLATQEGRADTLSPPTQLAGSKVIFTGSAGVERDARLLFVSPNQINCVIPEDLSLGAAVVEVQSADGARSFGSLLIEKTAPALFTMNGDGTGVAAAIAVRPQRDGSALVETVARRDAETAAYVASSLVPASETETLFLALFGTGLRGASEVSAEIDGVSVAVPFAGRQGEFAGLDQVNIGPIPTVLSGRGEVFVTLTADDRQANPVVVKFGGPLTAPRPRIDSPTAGNGFPGQTLPRLTLLGLHFEGATGLGFSDPSGITVSNLRVTDTLLTATLTLSSEAKPGRRGVWVETPAGRSNQVPFTIEGLSPIPKIFNLDIYPKSIAGNFRVAWIEFDFTDGDGDITFTGRREGSAILSIVLSSEGRSCNISAGADPMLDHEGKTTGYVHGMIYFPEAGPGTGEVAVTLTDSAANRSNTLTHSFAASCP